MTQQASSTVGTARLRPFAPRVVHAGRRGSRDVGRGQRFHATVLSLDVAGFTAMSEWLTSDPRFGAEEVRRRLNRVLAPAVRCILQRGGDVIGFSGDSVTAVFDRVPPEGAGVPGRMDAELAADELMQLPATSGLTTRVGVATGPTTIAVVGDPDTRLQTVVLGAAVDAAMAAQAAADPGVPRLVPVSPSADGATASRSAFHTELRPFVPSIVADRIVAGRSGLLADRRVVTTLFASIDLAPTDDPVRELQRVVTAVLPVLHLAGGELRQVDCGDKGIVVMAAFGATSRHWDDEQRAVNAGLDLVAIPGVQAVGIATGPTFCGTLGSGRRRDWLVVGASVNLAARLMSVAARGTVVVDRATAGALAPAALQPLEPVRLKGVASRTWCAIVVPAVGARRDAVRGGGASRDQRPGALVGRDEVVGTLTDAWRQSRSSTSSTPVVVTGPAGVGKSALLAAARQIVMSDGGRVVDVSCRDGVGPTVWRRAVAEVLNADGNGRWALLSSLTRLGVDEARSRLPLLAAVLGVHLADTGLTARLEPGHRTALAAALVADICDRSCQAVVVDDVHRADGFCAAVLDALTAAGVWVLAAGRAESSVSVWTPRRRVVVTLAGLEASAAAALVHARSGGVLDGEVVTRVVTAAAGNPLLLQQLAAHLATRVDALEELPTSLRRVIGARLDALSELDRAVVSVASVVGSDFAAASLTAVYPALGSAGLVDARLAALIDADLLTTSAETGASFTHPLLRDVAYERLPVDVREQLHGAVVAMLAPLLAEEDGLDRTVEVARHAALSRNRAAQRTWFARAADRARSVWSLPEAAAWYARLADVSRGQVRLAARLASAELDLMTGDGPTTGAAFRALMAQTVAGSVDRARVDVGLAESALRTAGTDDAMARLATAAEVFAECGRRQLQLRSLERLAFAEHRAGRLIESEATAAHALAVAQTLGDDAAAAEAYAAVGLAAWSLGRAGVGADRLRRSMELARRSGNLRCLVHVESDLAGLLAEGGDLAKARALLVDAQTVAGRIGYHRVQMDLMANQGELDRRLGDFSSAQRRFTSVLELAVRWRNVTAAATAVGNLGLLAAAAGDDDNARTLLRQAVVGSERTNNVTLSAEFADALERCSDRTAGAGSVQAAFPPAQVSAWLDELSAVLA